MRNPLQTSLRHAVDEVWAPEGVDLADAENGAAHTTETEGADMPAAAERAHLEKLIRERLAVTTGDVVLGGMA